MHSFSIPTRKHWVLALCTAALFCRTPAVASDIFWDESSTTCTATYSDAACWSGGVPNASDTAIWDYNHVSAYTVDFTGDATNASSEIRQDDIVWQLNGNTYNLTQISPHSLLINSTAPQNAANLEITNGLINAAGQTDIAFDNGDSGHLSLTNGGQLSDRSSQIGALRHSSGSVVVDGVGSSWNSLSNSVVGNSGTGTLSITNGGSVTNGGINIGHSLFGNGTVDVDGANSSLAVNGSISLGQFGGTGTLNILNGATVSIQSSSEPIATIGTTSNSGSASHSQGTVVVDGVGSSWNLNGANLMVGSRPSRRSSLYVQNGGFVSSGNAELAHGLGSNGSVIVDGVGSLWQNTGNLTIGQFGSGYLSISNGGHVQVGGTLSAQNGTLNLDGGTLTVVGGDILVNQFNMGTSETSTGTYTVDGSKTFTTTGDGSIGSRGQATLTIQNGGTFRAVDGLIVGEFDTGDGNVDVSGTLIADSDVTVGDLGVGRVDINTGGNVTVSELVLGLKLGGDGTVSVDGSGAMLKTTSVLTVGGLGTGNLEISNGGAVTVDTRINNGTSTGSGTITLSDGALNSDTLVNSGTITGNGDIGTAAGLSNIGTISLTDDTTFWGNVSNFAGANFSVDGGSTVFADSFVHNGADFQVAAGAQASFSGDYTGAGDFIGEGEITFSGNLQPGNSPALVSAEGDMTLLGSALTTIEIGGLLRGNQYDAFDVGGILSIDGGLETQFLNEFTPTGGDFFDLFVADEISGDFSSASFPTLPPGLLWELTLLDEFQNGKDYLRLSVVNAVPSPTSIYLFVTGLSILVGSSRNRSTG